MICIDIVHIHPLPWFLMVSGFFSAFFFHSLSLFCFQTNICNSINFNLVDISASIQFSIFHFGLWWTHMSLFWVIVLTSLRGLVASNVPLYTTVSHFFLPIGGRCPKGTCARPPPLGISYHIPCIECTCCTTVAFVYHAQKLYCDPLQFPSAPLPQGGCFS